MKKRNKKILALLLAVTTVMSMSCPALAEENDHSGTDIGADDEYPTYIGVYGNYLQRLDADKVLSVDVKWTSMNFQYAAEQQGTWNPESHTYDDPKNEGVWLNDSATITLNNHSNMAVKADLKFQESSAVGEEIDGEFTKDKLELSTAEGTSSDTPPSAETNFTVSGTLTENKDLGTITVSVNGIQEAAPLDISNLSDEKVTAAVAAWLNETNASTLKLSTSGQLGKTTVQAINKGIEESDVDSVALELSGATSIGEHGFSYTKASHITSVYAPDVTSISYYAFMSCYTIKNLTFPKVTSLQGSVFSDCTNIETLTFGTMITSPGSGNFSNMSTENIILTLSSEQKSGTLGCLYPATFGKGGTWLNYTWKEIKEYQA